MAGEGRGSGWGGCLPALLPGVGPGAEQYGAANAPVLLDGKCGEAAGGSTGQDEGHEPPVGHSGAGRGGVGGIRSLWMCSVTAMFSTVDNAHLPWTGTKIGAKLCQSYWRGWEKVGRLSLG